MKHSIQRLFIVGMTLGCLLGVTAGTSALAQGNPPAQPVELPCATNVSAQLLGSTPVEGTDQNLLLVRIIFDSDGSIGLHAHPGTLVVTVESGSLGFTYMDKGEMTITRADKRAAGRADREGSTADDLRRGRNAIEHDGTPGSLVNRQDLVVQKS